MLLTLLLAAATAFPATSRTAWMRPEAFHLELGASRAATVRTLEKHGWKTAKGKEAEQLIVEYGDGRSVTLTFDDGKLQSARFELVDFIHEVKAAFAEERGILTKELGPPSRSLDAPQLLTYEERTPQLFVVVSTDHNGRFGKQGLGYLVVRYFLPDVR